VIHIIVSGEAILSAENCGNLWAVGAPSRNTLEDLTALQQTTYIWWGGGFLPLLKNLTPKLGLWSRFSALRASFGILPNSLHSPVLRGLDKTLHRGTYYYAILRKIPLNPTGRKTPHTYPIVVSDLDISAECLPLHNPANRKIRLIFD